jgi:hypothetical protein
MARAGASRLRVLGGPQAVIIFASENNPPLSNSILNFHHALLASLVKPNQAREPKEEINRDGQDRQDKYKGIAA